MDAKYYLKVPEQLYESEVNHLHSVFPYNQMYQKDRLVVTHTEPSFYHFEEQFFL